MNLLFWNLHNNRIDTLVAELIIEKHIDIAVFAEYSGLNFQCVLELIGVDYKMAERKYEDDRVVLLCRKDYFVKIRRPQERYLLYSIKTDEYNLLLAGIHLQSNLYSVADDRLNAIFDMVDDITQEEQILNHTNTIVIGDFNANPFDKELTLKTGLNAVMFKELIRENEEVEYQSVMRKRFYNPMLRAFSESTKDYGSYYYSSRIDSLYWHLFDQVIVRKSLMDDLKSVQYCKRINQLSLINSIMPNKEISDHLPLIVSFEGEK